ncbi:MAG: hypothetical protein LC624_04510 [Halobacteriales archaeon]|nr:hypothetical protein [Halobacteriales archaeon]
MRAALAALLLVPLLAGCAKPPEPGPGSGAGWSVAPGSFTALDAPWMLRLSSGCGQCSGAAGYRFPAEHHAFLLLQDLRAVEVQFSVRPGSVGFHVYPNATLGAAVLEPAMRDLARARDGEVWVTRVVLGRVATDPGFDLPLILDQRWATPGTGPGCADCGGIDAWLNVSGNPRHVSVGVLNATDPFVPFLDLATALEGGAAQRGAVHGGGSDAAAQDVEGRAVDFAPLQGCEPQAGDAGTETFRDAVAFQASWVARCAPGKPAPAVDFAHNIVAGAWWGQQPDTGHRLGFASATKEGDHARVVVVRLTAGANCTVAHQVAYPGGFAAVSGAWPDARFEVVDRTAPC